MKKLMSLSIVLIGLLFVGCAPRIEYVPVVEIKEVKVPVAMNVKRIQCEFQGDSPDVVVDKMLICLKRFKTYNESLIKASEKINKSSKRTVNGKTK